MKKVEPEEMINWWRTSFGENEIARMTDSMRQGYVSQGVVTELFENRLSEFLEVEHVIAVNSGSSALLMALMSVGVKSGDEVIVPNRTWIATAHAVSLLGAKAIIVDVEAKRPIVDADKIEQAITVKTKAIIAVHMNGRSANMIKINALAKRYDLYVIEDAAQAIASKNNGGFLGTQSDVGCFSLSVAKTISTGQGGFTVTSNPELAAKMRAIRTHGIENVKEPKSWIMQGFNFRFTDILASIGIEQLKHLPDRVEHLKDIYLSYEEGLAKSQFEIIPVNINAGEVPIYAEFLIDDREDWAKYLIGQKVETRPFYPDIKQAKYLGDQDYDCRATIYATNGIYLPSGSTQKIDNISSVINKINARR